MKTESNIKPIEKFKIGRIPESKCEIYFNDLSSIIEEQRQRADEEIETVYIYDMYVLTVWFRENLKEDIEENYQVWLNFAKQKEVDELSAEIREKRNKLLEETDKDMALDRLNLNMPEDISMTNIIPGIKKFFTSFKDIFSSEMAKYRQLLRDIPQQPGFPYDIVWPEKPILTGGSK